MIKLDVTDVDDRIETFNFEQTVDTCPFCKKGIVPIVLSAYIDKRFDEVDYVTICWVVLKCPINKCRKVFIGIFGYELKKGGYFVGPGAVFPVLPKEETFHSIIQEISPSFVKIYNQAYFAEQYNLDLIVGPGYRKALEFLIKDYAIQISEESEKDIILNTHLGKVINTYIEDKRIKDTAKRAAWLGNDETHYSRKWEDEDLGTLKLLINLTTRWIESVELTKKTILDMPE